MITLVAALIALTGIVWLTWKLSRMHLMASILCDTIAAMLMDPNHATEIAENARKEMVEKGMMKDGK